MTHARLDRRQLASARAPWRAAAGVAVLGVVVSGCMTSKVDETRQVASPIQANESIVLLKKPQLEGVGTEEAFLDCIQERLGGELVHPEKGQNAHSGKAARTAFKIYGEQEFTDALFPWFEPSTAPANADGLRVLLARDRVVEAWLRKSVAASFDALKADPSRAVSVGAVKDRLAAVRKRGSAKK